VSRQPRRHGARPAPPPPSRDWPVIAVATAGFLVAGYLTVLKLMGGTAAFCSAGGGCDAVQSSRYAMMLGVPTALWGALVYAAVGGLAVAGLTASRWQAAFVLAAGAVGFSVYLTWLSGFVIGAFCGYCLASGVLAVALLAVLVWRRSAVGSRRGLARPGRLAALGAAGAIGAVVLGAGIFAGNPESSDPAYREALARHLTASGMIMYGGFT
jgi:uncharacterized membrane protein